MHMSKALAKTPTKLSVCGAVAEVLPSLSSRSLCLCLLSHQCVYKRGHETRVQKWGPRYSLRV